MRIGIIAITGVPFHADSLNERPLGGTETGVIHLAKELHKAGHQVAVVTSEENPPASEPTYLAPSAVRYLGELDVLIAVRSWMTTVSYPHTKVRCLWSGDSYNQPATLGLGDRRVAGAIDQLLLVSQWQLDSLCAASGFPADKAHVIRNGVALDNFTTKTARTPKRMIYSSTPFRGVHLLPTIFEKILKKHSDAELHVFSGEGLYPLDAAVVNEFNTIKAKLEKLPNCFVKPPITQDKLAIEMMKSTVLAYPNTFEETSCITAIEAMAAGCIPVTSSYGALPETIGDAGLLIQGTPGSTDYQQNFVAAVCELFDDQDRIEKLSAAGLKRAEEYSWEAVANRLTDKLEVLLKTKTQSA